MPKHPSSKHEACAEKLKPMSSKHVACAEKLMSTAIVFSTLPSANTAPVHWNSFCEALSRPCVQQTQCLCRKVDAETEQMRSLCRKAGSQTEQMRSLCRKVEAVLKHPSSKHEACAEKLKPMSSKREACAEKLMSAVAVFRASVQQTQRLCTKVSLNSFFEAHSRPCVQQTQHLCTKVKPDNAFRNNTFEALCF